MELNRILNISLTETIVSCFYNIVDLFEMDTFQVVTVFSTQSKSINSCVFYAELSNLSVLVSSLVFNRKFTGIGICMFIL